MIAVIDYFSGHGAVLIRRNLPLFKHFLDRIQVSIDKKPLYEHYPHG